MLKVLWELQRDVIAILKKKHYCRMLDMIGRSQIHPGVFRVMKINKLFPQSTHNMANTFTMSLSWMNTGIQMLKVVR